MSDLMLEVRGAVIGPKTLRSQPRIGLALRCWVVCAAYYLGTLLGYALLFPSSYISIMWPPNTVLLVALLLSAGWQWPWLLLFTFPVHLLVQAQFEVTLLMASLYYVYDCGLVLLTAGALRAVGLSALTLSDLRQALLFISVTTIAVAVGTLIWSPIIVYLVIGGDAWEPWALVFLSNLFPFLAAAPGFVIGLSRAADIVRSASLAQYTEFALLALGLSACAIGVFGLVPQALGDLPALIYAPLPFLLWAAVRFGPGGLSFAFVIFAVTAMFSAIAGYGHFVTESAGENVLRLQFFLLALYVPLLVLASVVADRRCKEAALRKSEARYRAVVEDQTELICRFLPDGTFTFVNGAYCRYFQRSPQELLGRTFWPLIPPEDHDATREFLASITPDHPVATREHEVLAPGGDVRWQHWRDRGFFDKHGRVVEYQAVGNDITDRKHTDEARQRLAHASRPALVGELTASIAHEINQPLAAILSNADAAEMLLDSSPAPLDEVRQILSDIRKDTIRASEVILRIRTLARNPVTESQLLNLNYEVTEVLSLLHDEVIRRGILLETALAESLPEIRGNKIQLQQVLLNLLMNSMESMTEVVGTKRLSVHTFLHDNGTAAVAITDTGIGIPPHQLTSLFQLFFSTKKNGIGLGLAIARSLVEAHGGKIWAENNSGPGATFTIAVPMESHVMSQGSTRGESMLSELPN